MFHKFISISLGCTSRTSMLYISSKNVYSRTRLIQASDWCGRLKVMKRQHNV